METALQGKLLRRFRRHRQEAHARFKPQDLAGIKAGWLAHINKF